jgi:peptide chain release factor 1
MALLMSFEDIKKEYNEILQQLSDPELISNWEKFEELSKRKKFLEKIIEKNKEIEEIKKKIEENKIIISAREDPELVSLAEAEINQLQEREKTLEKEISSLLSKEVEKKEEDESPHSVIVEIRAGAGGEEAALFAADLYRMYSKYAQKQGWRQRVLDSRLTELGGFKEVTFELKDGDVFSKMKYEGGVHRVQRIPETEKTGRIHTSTASVAVLPKPKKAEIKINPRDLKIDFYCASGPGGQYVQKRHTAVRITHLPTGIVVTSQTERNQLQNKENALAILEARLLEKKRMEEEEKISGKRKAQIGWAKRAEKIRTYNFPQDRVTDHRIKKSWHNIEEIMDGNLEPIISALQKSGQLQGS